jgi:hypothetical protein
VALCSASNFLGFHLFYVVFGVQLQCKEIILDEIDVTKGIVDFVMHRAVDKLVMGASNHGAIAGALIRSFLFLGFLS